MKEVTLYTTAFCPYCTAARRLLDAKGVAYKEEQMEKAGPRWEELLSRTGMWTLPQIFIGEKLIGGFEELRALEEAGELDRMLMDRGGREA